MTPTSSVIVCNLRRIRTTEPATTWAKHTELHTGCLEKLCVASQRLCPFLLLQSVFTMHPGGERGGMFEVLGKHFWICIFMIPNPKEISLSLSLSLSYVWGAGPALCVFFSHRQYPVLLFWPFNNDWAKKNGAKKPLKNLVYFLIGSAGSAVHQISWTRGRKYSNLDKHLAKATDKQLFVQV